MQASTSHPWAQYCTAGHLRHRCTIQTWTETEGDLGQAVKTPQTFKYRVPFRVVELMGRELFNAQQMQPDSTIAAIARWIPGVTSKMQLVWHDGDDSRTLAIAAPPINPDGKKRWMVLLCKEGK